MKKPMLTTIIILVALVLFFWLLNLHIWSQQLKGGVYRESTLERIIRIVTGRIDD